MRQEFNRGKRFDRAALAVFNHLRDNRSELTMPLVRSVLAELGSNANPGCVYQTVQQWLSAVENTRRLARQ